MSGTSASDEAGFTLVELLVAMVGAAIVIFALAMILIVTYNQTTRTSNRVQTTQLSRTAMASVENELHSACVGGGQAPIQGGSTATSMQFLSYYGSAATPTPVWHALTYNATAHTLSDSSYPVTGSAPNWTQGATQPTSTQVLLSNVTQRVDSSGNPIPVFQYYSYQSGSSDAGGTYWVVPDGTTTDPGTGLAVANSPLTIAAGGLTATQAQQAVEVTINLSAAANAQVLTSATAGNYQLTDSISLRLTTPPDEVPAGTTVPSGSIPSGYGPCQ
jgi:Tfp pilus assembly protein PilE